MTANTNNRVLDADTISRLREKARDGGIEMDDLSRKAFIAACDILHGHKSVTFGDLLSTATKLRRIGG